MDGLVSIGEMARRLGVAVGTLRRWHKEGKLLPALRTPGGHRRYDPDGGRSDRTGRPERTVVYARVSCSDQKDDLIRQRDRLLAHCAAQGWTDVEAITDLGSGLNVHKKGLLRLLHLVLAGHADRIVVENKDRLLRFGADLVFRICQAKGVRVVVTDDAPSSSFEADLARDVLEIVTVFSARLYGRRSVERRKAGKQTAGKQSSGRPAAMTPVKAMGIS